MASRIDLPVTYNFREVSGYQTPDGSIAAGRLYRSDALHRVDETGRERFASLGISTVIDLRDDSERRDAPSQLEGIDVELVANPILDPEAAPAHWGDVTLSRMYHHIVDERGAQLVQALRGVSAASGAALVHCTAGKDRTGLTVAFALLTAGVDRDDVIADYAMTESNLAGSWVDDMLAQMKRFGVEATPAVVELVSASPAELMDQILSRVESEYGGAERYLDRLGFGASEQELLRKKLIA